MLIPAVNITQHMMWGRNVVDYFIRVSRYGKLC